MTLIVLPALPAEKPHLVGLKRMAVLVTADQAGNLDAKQLQKSLESRLREAGIQVDTKSRQRLDVLIGISEIRTAAGDCMGFAYSIHLAVKQPVYLANSPNVMTDAVTWEGMWLGIASRDNLESKCAQSIAKRVDEFVAVYQEGL
jgi:hypothetical protein